MSVEGAFSLAAMALAAAATIGCGSFGKTAQGRVVAYNRQTRQMTLIPEAPAASKAVTVSAPADPDEMGPAPVAGGLMLLDTRGRRMVIYDWPAQSFRTITYTPLEERHNVQGAHLPLVDRAHKTITVYSRKDHLSITFHAANDLLDLPADTWQWGDVVRYYYKNPAQALRLMNVSQTDLSKST